MAHPEVSGPVAVFPKEMAPAHRPAFLLDAGACKLIQGHSRGDLNRRHPEMALAHPEEVAEAHPESEDPEAHPEEAQQWEPEDAPKEDAHHPKANRKAEASAH